MFARVLSLAVLTLVGWACYAQPIVKGTVRDSNHGPIPFCNVYAQRHSMPLQLAQTDDQGQYELMLPDTDSCELVITSVGYKKYVQQIRPEPGAFVLDVVLQPDTVVLDQVVVHAEHPIQNRGDTVVYDATYFATGNEVALSDLLKKLPGIAVDDQGKVKFRGKDVKRIKIEDDDLFEANYQILTKNLSADLVEQVQVLQNYSNNPLLKGIEDSDEVAINLTLRKDRRKTLFGDLRGGSNLKDRYEGKVNLVSFLSKAKFYALGSMNNVGADPTGDAEELQRSSEATHVVGDRVGSEYLVPVNKPYLSQFRRDRYYVNDARFASLHAILKPSDNLSVKLLGYAFHDRNNFIREQSTDYFTPLDTVTFREQSHATIDERLSHLKAAVLYKLSPTLHVAYNGQLHTTDGTGGQESNLNQIPVGTSLDYSATRQDHHVNLTRKFTDEHAIAIDVRYVSEGRPQRLFSNRNLIGAYFPTTIPSDSLYQQNDLPTDFFGAEANYYRRFSSAKLGIRAGYKHMDQTLQSNLESTVASLARNSLTDIQRETYGDVYYAWRKGAITITPAAAYQLVDVSLSDRASPRSSFFNPRLAVVWKISTRSNISLLYARGNDPATVLQQMRNPLAKDYNLVATNDGQFRTFARHTYMMNYQLGDWTSRFSLLATGFHQEFPNDYVGNLDVESNYTAVTTNQVADRRLTSFSVMADRLFKDIYTNLKIDWRANRTEFMTSTEGALVRTVAHGHTLDISMRSAFPGSFNAHVGHVMQASFTQSDLIEASNYSSLLYVDAYVTGLQQRLNITLHFERYALLSVTDQPTFCFVDIFARFRIQEAKPILVFLNARNLLNENIYAQRMVTPQTVSTMANQLIPRYILIGVEFKL